MVKHSQTIRRELPTICLSVFDHFVGLALKGLTSYWKHYQCLGFHSVNTRIFVYPSVGMKILCYKPRGFLLKSLRFL